MSKATETEELADNQGRIITSDEHGRLWRVPIKRRSSEGVAGSNAPLADHGKPDDAMRLILEARKQIKKFALGWSEERLLYGICNTVRFAMLNRAIPLTQRRRIRQIANGLQSEIMGGTLGFQNELTGLIGIAPPNKSAPMKSSRNRLAGRLLSELDGLSGISPEFRETLRSLARSERERGLDRRPWGGDRRSGERSLEASVLGQAVRLYCEAHERPRCSRSPCPLFRFANAVGELALGAPPPFTPGQVRAEFRRMKPKAWRAKRWWRAPTIRIQ